MRTTTLRKCSPWESGAEALIADNDSDPNQLSSRLYLVAVTASHPDGDDLYHYFSQVTTGFMTAGRRALIGNHVESCSDCLAIGRQIQEDEKLPDELLVAPDNSADEIDTQRSLAMFHAMVEKEMRDKQLRNTTLASARLKEVQPSLTESEDTWQTTVEMAKLIPHLAQAVTLRMIPKALAIIDKTINQLGTMSLLQPGAIHLLAYCAWALDYRERYFGQVSEAVDRFKNLAKKHLRLPDLALLNLAEGLVKFHEGRYADAHKLFVDAQDDADRSVDRELMTVVRYYQGRALWKLLRYEDALDCIRDAINRDLAANNQARVAAMELVEGWLLFLKGEVRAAQGVLGRARERLGFQSDALVDLGNILSFQGRLFREAGPDYYEEAVQCFAEAVVIYEEHDPSHRNAARTHLNVAFVHRLMARDLADTKPSNENRAQVQAEIEELRKKAEDEIRRAEAIYDIARGRHSVELSKLHSLRALLSFDAGDFDLAEREAETSYSYAGETRHYIGMANAKIIQSKVVLERGLNGYEDVDDALRLAREAIGFAEKTENRRVIARAYLREGHALLEAPEPDLWGARRSLEAARRRLVSEDRDYVSKSLAALDKLIKEAGRSKRLETSVIFSLTSESLQQEISAGHSLGDISEALEERIARFVCAELCDGNITRAGDLLKTGARKVRKAVSVFLIDDGCMEVLAQKGVPDRLLSILASFKGREIQGQANFVRLLKEALGNDLTDALESTLLAHVNRLQSRQVDTKES